MVLVVAQHSLTKPYTDVGRAMMLPALKLGLKGFELRDHSPLRRNPPDDERSVALALPTEVSETQEREGLWFSLSALFPVASGEPPELDQPCLVRVQFQTELGQAFPKLAPEPLGFRPVLEAHHKIVSVADDPDIALGYSLAPSFHP
jgi:hypothetical protein